MSESFIESIRQAGSGFTPFPTVLAAASSGISSYTLTLVKGFTNIITLWAQGSASSGVYTSTSLRWTVDGTNCFISTPSAAGANICITLYIIIPSSGISKTSFVTCSATNPNSPSVNNVSSSIIEGTTFGSVTASAGKAGGYSNRVCHLEAPLM